jgi:hypothetical protein
MAASKGKFDAYTRRARYMPMLIVLAPCSLLSTVLAAKFSLAIGVLIGPLMALGLPYWLSQAGRDQGKRKETDLFNLWGGKPTTVKLRHRDQTINVHTKARYHAAGQTLMPTLPFPVAKDEAADPRAADAIYEAFGDLLRDRTRDAKQFPLVFEELMNYGFRRNLWGWKPLGVALSAMVLLLLGGLLFLAFSGGTAPTSLLIGAIVVDAGFLGFWLASVNPSWVRIAADAYAERLLESSSNLL